MILLTDDSPINLQTLVEEFRFEIYFLNGAADQTDLPRDQIR